MTKYKGDPPHIKKAKEILARTTGGEYSPGERPVGVTTIHDLMAAENRLAMAQRELKDYQAGDDGMYESLNGKSKLKELNIQDLRFSKVENLRHKVEQAHGALQATKRAWLAGLGEKV